MTRPSQTTEEIRQHREARAYRGLSVEDRAFKNYEMRLRARRREYYKKHPDPEVRARADELSRFNTREKLPTLQELIEFIEDFISQPHDITQYPLLQALLLNKSKKLKLRTWLINNKIKKPHVMDIARELGMDIPVRPI